MVMVGHDRLGSGHDRFQMGDKPRCFLGESHMGDPPFNPLTSFGPRDAFSPLIYALLRHLLKLNVLRWGPFIKTGIIEGKD